MSAEGDKNSAEFASDDEVPVCSKCFTAFEPHTDYCVQCGNAVGQHTEYVPFVNIPWQATGYDRLRRRVWSSETGVFGQVVRMFGTLLLAPILLLGLPFKWLEERRRSRKQ